MTSKARKSTIGSNPLDAVIPSSSRREEPRERDREPETKAVKRPRQPEPEPEPARRERLTVQLDADLIEKARDACYWERITLAGLVEEGLRSAITKLERARGEEFTPRSSPIKRGRPFKG